MSRVFTLVIVMALIGSPAIAQESTAPATPRPTIAVADLETDRTGWVPPPRLGATLAELLTDRFVQSGQFRMIDRDCLADADMPAHGAFQQLRERARAAGVDYLVVGAVTEFGTERHGSTAGGFVPILFIGGLFHKTKVQTAIGLTLRVIDVKTGEVVATATSNGSASEGHVSGGAVAVVGKLPLPIGGGGGSTVSGFQDRLVDSATQQAVSTAAEKILSAPAWQPRGGR